MCIIKYFFSFISIFITWKYFRISTFRLTLLPLALRKGDILPLTAHIISSHAGEHKTISSDAQTQLLKYSWPGNVRELDNVVQRALVLCPSNEINSEHLIFDEISNNELKTQRDDDQIFGNSLEANLIEGITKISDSSLKNDEDRKNTSENLELTVAVKTSEFKTIISAIKSTSSRTAAAKKLGISPRTLRYKIAQLKNMGIPELSFD